MRKSRALANVAFSAVSKSYAAYAGPIDRFRKLLSPNGRRAGGEFWALRDVSFEARSGETLCLIGANGSGKSTSLQLAAGILQPTAGRVEVEGRVAALLELGAGFHPEFSGRENAYLSGAVFGLSTGEIRKRFAEIERFAEIGDFIDRPVKTYSSGMAVRLAFAVAISVEPEILLVDEALAVGDYYFRQRCMRKVHELRSKQVTILFVSHAMADVQALGTRVLWLDEGRIREQGDPRTVVRKYLAHMTDKDATGQNAKGGAAPAAPPRLDPARELAERIPNVDHRFGTGRAEVLGIVVLDERGREAQMLVPRQPATVRIRVRAKDWLAAPNVGFMMRNHLGIDFAGTNTHREGYRMAPMQPGEVRSVNFRIELPELYAGTFSFAPAVADGDLSEYEICDWIDNALVLPMARSRGEVYGYLHLPCRVQVEHHPVTPTAGSPTRP